MTTIDLSSPSETATPNREPELAGFLAVVAPLVTRSRARLRRALATLHDDLEPGHSFDGERIEAALFAPVPDRLIRMLSRTLVLELRVADLRGSLAGATPEARYAAFIERLESPEVAHAIFREYPVLARLLEETLDRWVHASTLVIRHLCEDWAQLTATFGDAGSLAVLDDVRTGAGDVHRGGRSVAIVTFGGGRKLVYKPRSLATDRHVQELLAWLNARGDHPPFREITVLDQGDHGWVEHVEAAPGGSEAAAHLYYRRLGGLLAVAYVLDAIDLHYENVIAAGEHPVLLDLETLFHPQLVALDESVAYERALGVLCGSVMGPGLLPQRIYGGATDTGMDVSGLGMAAAQETPFEVPRWSRTRTSEMAMTRVRAQFKGTHNRSMVDGVPTDPVRFSQDLISGFAAIYRLCWTQRADLLAPAGPITRFADDEVRVLLRPTRSYFRLLDESHHPDVLRDAEERDALFDALRAPIEISPALQRTIDAERADLWRGDIPLFTTTPTSRDLVGSNDLRIADVLPESGMARVQRRIHGLGDADLQHQCWLIAASLSTLSSPHRNVVPSRDVDRVVQPATAERLISAALAIGERLIATAIHGERDATWLGLTSLGDGARLEPLGTDLYDGLPGVALFLAHLGRITGRADVTRLAHAAIMSLRGRLADEPLASPGAFIGAGGIIYTYAHLGRLWDDADSIALAHELAERIPGLVAADQMFDVVGGAAGAILGLASLWRIDPTDAVRRAAAACGERLLTAALPQSRGLAWPSPIHGAQPLTGMSHGAAGIAAALAVLSNMLGDDRHLDTARAAIEYERSLFAPELGNWPDFRFGLAQCQTAWCHGAPGIGLARLRCGPQLDDDATREEITAALATTVDHELAGSHCLCHGGFGNIELVLQAATASAGTARGTELRSTLDRWTAVLLDDVERTGPRCATKLGIETPGLMSGLSGIGLQLLRLVAPDRVPSILTLATPRASEAVPS